MNNIAHERQKQIWNDEHHEPKVLLQMDSKESSGGVVKFWKYMQVKGTLSGLTGIEMGCGKGRNVIWLAEQKEIKKMYGFDFSSSAIATAKKRAIDNGVGDKTEFTVGDATEVWPFPDNFFDFVIDCFASTDIESSVGRASAIKEILRILRPGGELMVYTLTPDDEFHKEMVGKSPAAERNAFYHTTGKFEKTFDREELEEMYEEFEVLEWQRVEKTTQFFGKDYKCYHYWLILKKPLK